MHAYAPALRGPHWSHWSPSCSLGPVGRSCDEMLCAIFGLMKWIDNRRPTMKDGRSAIFDLPSTMTFVRQTINLASSLSKSTSPKVEVSSCQARLLTLDQRNLQWTSKWIACCLCISQTRDKLHCQCQCLGYDAKYCEELDNNRGTRALDISTT